MARVETSSMALVATTEQIITGLDRQLTHHVGPYILD